MNKLLEKAIKYSGTQAALAAAINEFVPRSKRIKQQYISKWLNRTKNIPAEYVLPIERAVNGAVTRYDLRPDIYPREG